MAAREVAYRSTNVEEEPEGLERLARLGARTVPVVARGGDWAMGLDLDKVARLVGVAGPGLRRLDPGELVGRIETVLAATGRYLRQIPDDRLDDRLPGRDRGLAELGHHVFVVADSFLDVARGGTLTAERLATPPEDWMRTGADLDRFGREVSGRVRDWWSSTDDPSCAGPAETYYASQTLHEVLERTAWHAAQHARQLMMVLGNMGIAPDGPLTESDLAGLPLPEKVWDD